MKRTLIMFGLLSAVYLNVQCMDEAFQPFYQEPPAYSAVPASAPQDEAVSGLQNRVPQATDIYMTYQEWWEQNDVPRNVRSQSVQAQATWMAEKNARLVRKQEEDAGGNGCVGFGCGVFAACIVMKTLAGLP